MSYAHKFFDIVVMDLHSPPPECGLNLILSNSIYTISYRMSLLRLGHKKTIVSTLSIPFPSTPLSFSVLLSYYLLWVKAVIQASQAAC